MKERVVRVKLPVREGPYGLDVMDHWVAELDRELWKRVRQKGWARVDQETLVALRAFAYLGLLERN